MFIKVAGSVLVWAGCSFMGLYMELELHNTIWILEQYGRLLQILYHEIESYENNLAVAFYKASKMTTGRISNLAYLVSVSMTKGQPFIESFDEIWQKNLLKVLGKYPARLTEREEENLHLPEKYIGFCSKDVQLNNLKILQKENELCLEDSKEFCKQTGRMYRYLGILTGAVCAVLII